MTVTTATELDPQRLVWVLRERLARSPNAIAAYWLKVGGDRHALLSELVEELGDTPIIPIVVRGALFDNPNAILEDLRELIIRERDAFRRLQHHVTKCGIVLLARNELNVSQVSSPIVLPEWFPLAGGTTTSIIIEDLTWTAAAPLNAREVRQDEICAGLFRLEGVILRRLQIAHGYDHNCSNALFEYLKSERRPYEKYKDLLNDGETFRRSVKNPESFRPSVRELRSLVGRLWALTLTASPDELLRRGKVLAGALLLKPVDVENAHECIMSVILRPTTRDPEPVGRFGRNLLISMYGSCQLITAAAHADDYGAYPVALLRTLSYDFRASVESCERILSALSDDITT